MDLDPLFDPPPSTPDQPTSYRQGTVLAWNPQTGQNSILVGRTPMADLPILNTSEASLLGPGSVVGLIKAGTTYAILGRLVIPNTSDAATALEIVSNNIYTASDSASGTRTGTAAYGDLSGASVGPAISNVYIGRSGKCVVIVGATIADTSGTFGVGGISYDISGATSRSAGLGRDFVLSDGTTWGIGGSRICVETGLTSGLHTFTAKYRTGGVGDTASFSDRVLVVIAL